MIEDYISRESMNDIYTAGFMTSGMTDEQSMEILSEMEKDSQALGWTNLVGRTVVGSVSGLGKLLLEAPSAFGTVMLAGAGLGTLGTMAYDSIKENLSKEDPKEKLNNKIEAYYKNKTRESEDAKWIADARAKRDKLMREKKKMSPEEYSKAYNDLKALLDTRRDLA